MSKKKRFVKRDQRGDKSKKMSIITFGKPEPVLTTGTDYRDIWYDNAADHFTQPIDRLALAQLINLNGQHGGIIHARKNMIVSDYQGGGLIHDQLEAAAFDYITFGDIAIAKIRNGWGDVIALEPLPGLYIRRRKVRDNAQDKPGDYVVLQEGEPQVWPEEDINEDLRHQNSSSWSQSDGLASAENCCRHVTGRASLHFPDSAGLGGRPSPSISHLWQRLRYLLRRRHRFCR